MTEPNPQVQEHDLFASEEGDGTPLDPFDGIQIEWKDGLPKDPAEESTIETTLITAGLTSKYSAIKRLLDGDDEATQAEMDRIEEEHQKSMDEQMAMGMGGPAPPGNEMAQSAQMVANVKANKQKKDEKAKETGQSERQKK